MFAKQVSSFWTWLLVKRHHGMFQSFTPYPQEDPRMKVSNEMERDHVRNLEQYIKEFPTDLILNVDDMGSQDLTDRMERD
jgi:hypothetical protein